jgi:signal transduction histidine kinase
MVEDRPYSRQAPAYGRRERLALLAMLFFAFAGSIVGLVAVVLPGIAGPAESILLSVCALFSGSLLALLLFGPAIPLSRVAAAASLYFTLHLGIGSALTLWKELHLAYALPYLLWYFALLSFNKFTNLGTFRRTLDAVITAAPLLLVAVSFVLQRESMAREEAALLGVYALSYAIYALFFSFLSQYRDESVARAERARSVDRQNALLRESGERLRRLFDDASIGIAELDSAGRVVSANATLRGFLGLAPGDDPIAVLDPGSASAWREALASVSRGGSLEKRLEIRPIDASQRRTFACRLSYLPERGELPEGRIAVCVDVTRQLEREEQLRQSQKLQAIGQLTGGIAHDFNNLLTVIMGNSELLSEMLAHEEELRGLADLSSSAARRGAELTQRLLAFARRQPLDPRVVDCTRLIEGARPLLQRTLGEATPVKVIENATGLFAEVDPGQFEVALLNLVINARDAMPAGGDVLIGVHRAQFDVDDCREELEILPGDYVCVSVTDNGMGIASEVLGRVFEPFFTTKQSAGGNGLGLSMVYGFVKQSGGHVNIESRVGEGTTVRLYFPRVERGEDESDAIDSSVPVVGGLESIMVVEDDKLVRDHVASAVRSLGYQVIPCAGAEEALSRLSGPESVDVLFTDVVMPGAMNGRDLAREAVKLRPGLRVLYTSGYAEEVIVHDGRLDAGVQLLSKPYRRQDLARALRRALDG